MKLIVGLGNPGTRYLLNRHNIGFMLVDALAQAYGAGAFRSEHQALVSKTNIGDTSVMLVKPQTFMNLSGESVRALMDYYKISAAEILVAHDEIDLPFGKIRLQSKRGAGGHNGIKSLHQHLGTDDYARLRMGVGRPTHPEHDVADYVLSNFSVEEQEKLAPFFENCLDAIEMFLAQGLERAANRFNANDKEA